MCVFHFIEQGLFQWTHKCASACIVIIISCPRSVYYTMYVLRVSRYNDKLIIEYKMYTAENPRGQDDIINQFHTIVGAVSGGNQ